MKNILEEILKDIKRVNDERELNSQCYIAEDDINEEITNILSNYFLEEFQNGEDIDSCDFLEDKFGVDFQLIRDAEQGIY